MESNIPNMFENIYKAESDAIFRFCFVRVSNRDQALDITQETFLRLWQSLSNGKEILNNRAFLFTVAHRLIIDWYRKKKSFSLDQMLGRGDEEPKYDVPDEREGDSVLGGAEGRYLLGKINELSPTHRDPMYLRFVEGLSPPEIGEILGISANAASVRVNRALKELRRQTGYDGLNDI
jgi:RNA polymerase sigma-70 factor, ECF subfamily